MCIFSAMFMKASDLGDLGTGDAGDLGTGSMLEGRNRHLQVFCEANILDNWILIILGVLTYITRCVSLVSLKFIFLFRIVQEMCSPI